jgi:serine protease AprX
MDNHQGDGLVNLASTLKPSQSRKLRMQNVRPGLRTGEEWHRTVTISASAPLRVVLAYSDFPGPSLVNNLNLLVTAPNGTRFVGNQAQAGSVTLDSANNVEMVDVSAAAAGQWRIDVVGSNVPEGPQEFALVILGRVV